MEPNRLSEWLRSATGLGNSLVGLLLVFFSLWAEFTKYFLKVAEFTGLPTWTPRAVAILVIVAFSLVLIRSARRFACASRLEQPDAFTLRPTGPATLIGRTEDTAKLLRFVKNSRLVLLDGESGCGKSALVSAGRSDTRTSGVKRSAACSDP